MQKWKITTVLIQLIIVSAPSIQVPAVSTIDVSTKATNFPSPDTNTPVAHESKNFSTLITESPTFSKGTSTSISHFKTSKNMKKQVTSSTATFTTYSDENKTISYVNLTDPTKRRQKISTMQSTQNMAKHENRDTSREDLFKNVTTIAPDIIKKKLIEKMHYSTSKTKRNTGSELQRSETELGSSIQQSYTDAIIVTSHLPISANLEVMTSDKTLQTSKNSVNPIFTTEYESSAVSTNIPKISFGYNNKRPGKPNSSSISKREAFFSPRTESSSQLSSETTENIGIYTNPFSTSTETMSQDGSSNTPTETAIFPEYESSSVFENLSPVILVTNNKHEKVTHFSQPQNETISTLQDSTPEAEISSQSSSADTSGAHIYTNSISTNTEKTLEEFLNITNGTGTVVHNITIEKQSRSKRINERSLTETVTAHAVTSDGSVFASPSSVAFENNSKREKMARFLQPRSETMSTLQDSTSEAEISSQSSSADTSAAHIYTTSIPRNTEKMLEEFLEINNGTDYVAPYVTTEKQSNFQTIKETIPPANVMTDNVTSDGVLEEKSLASPPLQRNISDDNERTSAISSYITTETVLKDTTNIDTTMKSTPVTSEYEVTKDSFITTGSSTSNSSTTSTKELIMHSTNSVSTMSVTEILIIPTPTTEDICKDWIPKEVVNISGSISNGFVNYTWIYPEDRCQPTNYTVFVEYHGFVKTYSTNNLYIAEKTNDTCLNVNVTIAATLENGNFTNSTKLLRIGDDRLGLSSIFYHETNATYIRINFTSPNINPSCIDSYNVEYHDTNLSNEIKRNVGLDKTAEITGLEPCTSYKLRIESVYNDKTAKGNYMNIATHKIQPGNPENLKILYDTHIMNASWEPSSTARNCEQSYDVILLDANSNEIINKTEVEHTKYTAKDLHSCKSYKLQVTTKDGNSTLNATENLFTMNKEAPPAPNLGKVEESSTRYLKVTWNLPDLKVSKYGCGFKSIQMTCKMNHDNITGTPDDFVTSTMKNVTLELTKLTPNRLYECFATLKNEYNLTSSESSTLYIQTKEEAPKAPENLSCENITPSNIIVRWDPPLDNFATVTGYLITVTCVTDAHSHPYCGNKTRCPEPVRQSTLSANENHFIFNSTANTKYTVTVKALSNVGYGSESKTEVTSLMTAAGPVVNLGTNITTPNSNDTSLTINIFWFKPCLTAGNFSHYKVKLNGTRSNYFYDEKMSNTLTESITFTDLMPEFNYSLYVQTNYNNVPWPGIEEVQSFFTPALVPEDKENDDNKLIAEATEISDPRTQVKIHINSSLFSEKTGHIRSWFLIVSTKNLNKNYSFGAPPNLEYWGTTNAGEKDMYQATATGWNPFKNNEKNAEYILGEQEDCKPGVPKECNGPLQPDTNYFVLLRAATSAGYRDLSVVQIKTDPDPKLTIILVCIFVSILVLLVGSVLLMMRRRHPGWPHKLMATLFGMTEEHQNPRQPKPVSVEKFSAHYDAIATEVTISGDSRITEEFRLLATLSPPAVNVNPMLYSIARLPENKFKNRYINILPYDETRVKISVVDDDPSSDYINASFIKGYSGVREYIASQGPKLETCEDFWRMVFEHDVTVIVMVTNLTEKGKDKCYQYYPNLRETKDFCFVHVKCVTEVNFPVYTSRTLLVQKDNLQKTVVQLHFREWPDFGCPVSTELMLSFCQTVRQQFTMNQGLILVHCSAGVGRTGTLIAVDILLQHMQEHKKLDVFGTILKLRQQRINMVQTEGQYAYIHQCMRDAIEDPSLLNSESSSKDLLEPIYANVSIPLVHSHVEPVRGRCKNPMPMEEPHKKFNNCHVVQMESECESLQPPPDEFELPEYGNFPPPPDEEPEYGNLPPPLDEDEEPEYENFPPPPPLNDDDVPEYGNFPPLPPLPSEEDKYGNYSAQSHDEEPEYSNISDLITDDNDMNEDKFPDPLPAEMHVYPTIIPNSNNREVESIL